MGEAEPLLLRGIALDYYNDRPGMRGAAWQWVRTASRFERPTPVDRGQSVQLDDEPSGADRYVQTVNLRPTGTRALFAMAAA